MFTTLNYYLFSLLFTGFIVFLFSALDAFVQRFTENFTFFMHSRL